MNVKEEFLAYLETPIITFRKSKYSPTSRVMWRVIVFLEGVKYAVGTTIKMMGTHSATVGCPQEIQTPSSYRAWETENSPVEKDGFKTRDEAAKWAIKRSLECGVLRDEYLKRLSPLEQLAELG
ncbi:MAG: hypothetical protein MN733_00015 [Nitrososphaera sp.]|nr:hypothetical protein [Nitrososphaera sp.]